MPRGEPLVSVIVPTYNREPYLREAAQSVFDQTYGNWELIVVDDGSTDGTRSYLRSLKDERVRLIELDHCGNPARLRNAGIAQARGRYVAFLDSDDLWMPEKLELQIGDLLEHPDCHWSYTNCRRINQYGEQVPLPRGKRWRPFTGWILEPVISVDAWVATPAVVVEREAIREIGGFDETLLYCEDYDLWVRLSMRWQACAVDRPVTVIRLHPGCSAWGRIEALESLVQVHRRLMTTPSLATVRRQCRRQYVRAAVDLVNRYRSIGSYGRAFRTLLASLTLRPASPGWWVALLKTCVRPLLPPAAMRVYRGVRARMSSGAP